MKPFNVEEAKSGKTVVTRDGRKVRILFCEAKGELPIVALIESEFAERPISYYANGRMSKNNEYDCDLFMDSEKKTYYINVYKEDQGNPFTLSFFCDTKASAISSLNQSYGSVYLGTFPIEIEI